MRAAPFTWEFQRRLAQPVHMAILLDVDRYMERRWQMRRLSDLPCPQRCDHMAHAIRASTHHSGLEPRRYCEKACGHVSIPRWQHFHSLPTHTIFCSLRGPKCTHIPGKTPEALSCWSGGTDLKSAVRTTKSLDREKPLASSNRLRN